MDFGFPTCIPVGAHVLVLEGDPACGLPLQRRLWRLSSAAREFSCVREAVTGDGNLTLLLDRNADRSSLVERLRELWGILREAGETQERIVIPVRYDGMDIDELARRCALTVDALISIHCAADYTVSFLGFQPGFAYLDGLDKRLRVPRRDEPRARVPAGSVAVARRYSAVYPLDSPGGWHIIGSTNVRLFDPTREPFALLSAGDRVQFVRA
jgi:KipI family sensor histidine kinase inhibitor